MRCCRTARRRIRTLTERSAHRYYGRCVRVQLQPRLRYKAHKTENNINCEATNYD